MERSAGTTGTGRVARRWRRRSTPAGCIVALTLMMPTTIAAGVQVDDDDDLGDGLETPHDIALPSETEPMRDTARGGRTGLLREGSFLVEARGTLERDATLGWWVFTLEHNEDNDAAADGTDAAPEQAGPALIILPNAVFAEMQQSFERLEDDRVVFEVTGQVFVYRGRNFLLPTHAPRLERYAADEPPAADDDADGGADEGDDAEARDDAGAAAGDTDDPVARVERDLQRAVGALARSPQMSQPASVVGEREASAQPAFADGAILVQRRGKIVRDPGGAWLFVFDADANGLSDPPLIILPCQLLEHIEMRALQRGLPLTVLMSGTALTYQDRNYLLPSIYRLPRDRNGLSPTGGAR